MKIDEESLEFTKRVIQEQLVAEEVFRLSKRCRVFRKERKLVMECIVLDDAQLSNWSLRVPAGDEAIRPYCVDCFVLRLWRDSSQ